MSFLKKGVFILIILASLVSSEESYAQEKALEEITSEIDSINHKPTLNVYPYAFYTPETQLAFGAGGIFIFYTGEDSILRPSKTSFGAYYSTNKQYKLSMNNKLYFFRNKLYFNWSMAYGYYIDRFYGIGNSTPETGTERYSKQIFTTQVVMQLPPRWFSSDLTGIIFDFEDTEIVEKMENEYLINNSVQTSNGTKLYGLGTDLMWDSRDNIFFPNSGSYQYFKIVFYNSLENEVFSFLELDVRHFHAIKKDMVLAGMFYIANTTGDVPFYRLPGIGGKKMRGFFEGRYRDNFMAIVQLEYRHMVWPRFGYAVFGGVGDVSSEMLDFNFDLIKYNYGLGLRLMFNEKERVNLRVDFGIGTDGNAGLYFGIEEAF